MVVFPNYLFGFTLKENKVERVFFLFFTYFSSFVFLRLNRNRSRPKSNFYLLKFDQSSIRKANIDRLSLFASLSKCFSINFDLNHFGFRISVRISYLREKFSSDAISALFNESMIRLVQFYISIEKLEICRIVKLSFNCDSIISIIQFLFDFRSSSTFRCKSRRICFSKNDFLEIELVYKIRKFRQRKIKLKLECISSVELK